MEEEERFSEGKRGSVHSLEQAERQGSSTPYTYSCSYAVAICTMYSEFTNNVPLRPPAIRP